MGLGCVGSFGVGVGGRWVGLEDLGFVGTMVSRETRENGADDWAKGVFGSAWVWRVRIMVFSEFGTPLPFPFPFPLRSTGESVAPLGFCVGFPLDMCLVLLGVLPGAGIDGNGGGAQSDMGVLFLVSLRGAAYRGIDFVGSVSVSFGGLGLVWLVAVTLRAGMFA